MDSEFFRPKDQNEFYVGQNVKQAFDKNGYILVRNLITAEEIKKLKNYTETNADIHTHCDIAGYSYGVDDGKGRKSKLCLWNHPGNDITGTLIRSQKIAGTTQALLGGEEIYHYSTKLMMKEPHTGGSFLWHQDYGYFYENGCIFPEMAAIFIPIDQCVKANGCLKVLKGSHRLGRINHNISGQLMQADSVHLEAAFQNFPLIDVEMMPGDVLFFHCNLLHSSDKNDSNMRRWVMITSMNKRKNEPIRPCPFPMYKPLNILPNSEILNLDENNSSSAEKQFLKGHEEDTSTASLVP